MVIVIQTISDNTAVSQMAVRLRSLPESQGHVCQSAVEASFGKGSKTA